jgi:hypothetical protein
VLKRQNGMMRTRNISQFGDELMLELSQSTK